MTRRIDSDAINKRLFDEISDLDNHSRRIRGENFKESTENWHSLEHPNAALATVMDNANLNGIEFSKIKQLINYMQTHKKEFVFDEILDRVDNEPKETALSQYGTIFDNSGEVIENTDDDEKKNLGKDIPNTKTELVVPDGFDGRSAFVFPRIALLYENGAMDWEVECWKIWDKEKADFVTNAYDLEKRIVEQNESFHFGLAMQGDVNNVNCWSAPIEGTTASWLMVAKQKEKIIITTKANLAVYNAGYDADHSSRGIYGCKDIEENNHVVAAYVYALVMYWRDK